MADNSVLKGLKPEKVFEIFGEILSVPRPSKHEERMTKFLMDWAEKRGLEHERDEIGNVIIRKGASKGMENKAWVCLQSHMDMVCEKNGDKVFDFMKDPIEAQIVNQWLMAKGIDMSKAEDTSKQVSLISPSARYSTLQDLDAGRHTEIDMFSGALVRMGKELGIPMPYNEYTYHIIKALEEKNDGKFEYTQK